jgi:hypothetical protein
MNLNEKDTVTQYCVQTGNSSSWWTTKPSKMDQMEDRMVQVERSILAYVSNISTRLAALEASTKDLASIKRRLAALEVLFIMDEGGVLRLNEKHGVKQSNGGTKSAPEARLMEEPALAPPVPEADTYETEPYWKH